jgi:hypothetical protein
MDNAQISENLKDLNLFFDSIGFDEKTKKDHLERIMRIIIVSVAEKLEKATGFHEKSEFPEMKSVNDFYDYYEQYIDRETIAKVIEEETHRQFTEYIDVIREQLPK